VRRVLTILTSLFVVLGLSLTVWTLYPRAPVPPARFLRHKGDLTEARVVERTRTQGVVSEEIRLTSSTGLEVHALVRYREAVAGRRPAFLLLGGLRSGRRALEGLDVARLPLFWMAIDYVYTPPPSFPGPRSIPAELSRAEEGVEKTVAGMLLALDYLETRPEVDPARTGLGGGSLGAFCAVIAGALDPRFEAVAALYGGARPYKIVENTLRIRSPLARRAAALLLRPWLEPVDPIHYVPRISPRPFLMVNGRHDTWIPADCVHALYGAAKQPKEIHWVDTPHRVQGQPELLAQVAEVAVEWLGRHGWLEALPAQPEEPR
jgi:dienelactone hydrolase